MNLSTLAAYNRDTIIADKIGVEKGYSNNKNDRGGETKYGVTLVKANEYKGYLTTTFGWDGSMQSFTPEMAIYVYIQGFWNQMSLDGVFAVHPLLADKLFDIGINMGTGKAGEFFQRCLNSLNKNTAWFQDLKVDGDIGPATLLALRIYVQKRGLATAAWHLLVMMCSLQGNRYIEITEGNHSQEEFTDGWEERVGRDIGHYALLMGHAI